jgi:hypothetical protein
MPYSLSSNVMITENVQPLILNKKWSSSPLKNKILFEFTTDKVFFLNTVEDDEQFLDNSDCSANNC